MIDAASIEEASDRISDVIRRTPMLSSTTLGDIAGAEVVLKCEMLQRTGSFKVRGATNRIRTLDPEVRRRGVVTASGGNHAQGVAFAATMAGVRSTIVMPERTSRAKVEATRSYGGEVILHGRDYNAAAARAHAIEREEGLTYVHAFEDPAVIAGQGTLGLEVLEECPTVETIIVPIGGGGLIAGIALAVAHSDVDARVIGVQAAGADAASRSVEAGELIELEAVDTIAEGMATRHIGELTLDIITEHVDHLVTVSDVTMSRAIHLLLERSKLLTEPAGAAAVAALLEGAIDPAPAEVVVPVLSGGNLDIGELPRVLDVGDSS